jgi:LacI family gluconate utilization system Gnt-I transcriptional repressor
LKASLSRPKNHRSTGRITLNDVAQAAGVSPSTVSRALRGERAVDPDLVLRVLEVSDKLGYVPDPAARALASQRSDHVTILIPLLSNALFVDLLEAAQRTLRAAGFQTLMGVTHYNASEEEQLLREQLHHRPAGMLITGLDHSPTTQKLMARSNVPCVHLMDLPENKVSNASLEAVDEALSQGPYCVGFRQTDAGEAMTQHLMAQGKERIVFAAAQLDPRVMQRLQGWRKALKMGQLYDPTLEWLNPAPSSLALGGLMGFAWASRVITRGADPYQMASWGALTGLPAFMCVILAAPLMSVPLFVLGIFLIGLGGGLFAHGTLTASMNLAPPDQTGLAMGAWGAVQATAAGIGVALGGLLRDGVAQWTDSVTGYTTVYGIEVLMLILTLVAMRPLLRNSH